MSIEEKTNNVKSPKNKEERSGEGQEAQYENLEREFQEILDSISGDERLDKFRIQYERLYRCFKSSYENEKRHLNRCKELNDIILNNTAKMKAAIDMSKEDANTIKKLQSEIDKSWKLIEQQKEKEEKSKKAIQELKQEIGQLSKIVDTGSGFALQENSIEELTRVKDDLKKQLEMRDEDIKAQRTQISALLEEKIKLNKELSAERINNENLEKEKLSFEEEIKNKDKKMETQNAHYSTLKKNYQETESKCIKEEELNKKITNDLLSIQGKLKEEEFKNKELIERITMKEIELKKKEDIFKAEKTNSEINFKKLQELAIENKTSTRKIGELSNNNLKLEREITKLKNHEILLEKQKEEIETEKKLIIESISNLEREIDSLRRENDLNKNELKNITRDKDLLANGVRKAEDTNVKQKVEADKGLGKVKMLEDEIKNRGKDIEDIVEQKKKLEAEKNKFGTELAKLSAKYRQLEEECKLKDNLKNELERKIQELKEKLKEQQKLYEIIRSDRNTYSKNLIEIQDKFNENKRKYKIAIHQINQLKDEIDAKDSCLVKETTETHKVTKMNDQLKAQIKALESSIEKIKDQSARYEKEIQKLNMIIKQGDDERKKLKQDYESAITERDIFGTQLIRRNDELALLYEKIKILQSTLSKGEIQYQERMNDISILQRKCVELNREVNIFKSQSSSIIDYKKEIYHLEKELIQERLQVKALSEELETPVNCHRWRKLEGTDPDTFEMIQKIKTLQKRLIKKTEEVIEKEMQYKEKEKMIEELQDLLRRQPGPEVIEQLNIYQQHIKEKTRQMKAMAAELNMFQAQINEYKYEIDKVTRELQDMKMKYYEYKRRDQLIRDVSGKSLKFKAKPEPSLRYAGGGFNLIA